MSDEPRTDIVDTQIELKSYEEERERARRPAPPLPPQASKRASLKPPVSDADVKTELGSNRTLVNSSAELKPPEEDNVRPKRPDYVPPPPSSKRISVKAAASSLPVAENVVEASVSANVEQTASLQGSDVDSIASSDKGALRRKSTNPFEYDVYAPSANVSSSSISNDEESQVVRNPLAGKLKNAPPSSSGDLSLSSNSSSKKRSSVHLINPDIGKSPEEIAAANSVDKPARVKPPKGSMYVDPAILGPGQPSNQIYHKNLYSELWMVIFVVGIIVQFSLLLVVGYDPLPVGSFIFIIILLLGSVSLVLFSRMNVKKSKLSASRNIALRNGECSPDDEADEVSDIAIYALGGASVLLGLNFAVFTSVLSGSNVEFPSSK